MPFKINRVAVVGLGYIGLPTAALLADHGVDVIGIDVNESAVETINQGKIHIVEPNLEAVVNRVVSGKKLRATTDFQSVDVFIITVPTPFKEDHKPDLSYVYAAAKMLAPHLQKGNLVILESTSPVGTTEQMMQWLTEWRPDLAFPQDVSICYCPERVIPGKILEELINNDRVLGGITLESAEKAHALYKIFVKGDCLLTNARTAELVKLTENSYRDTNIAFANEISLVCDQFGVNVWELIKLANHHPRVSILNPGCGVGGHCIAVDPWFIVDGAPGVTPLIRAARQVNDGKPLYILNQVSKALEGLSNPVVACFGLTFKKDIDDMRESPALKIAEKLSQMNGIKELLLVEPHVACLPKSLSSSKLVSAEDALAKADVFVVLVDHSCFKELDFSNKILINPTSLYQ